MHYRCWIKRLAAVTVIWLLFLSQQVSAAVTDTLELQHLPQSVSHFLTDSDAAPQQILQEALQEIWNDASKQLLVPIKLFWTACTWCILSSLSEAISCSITASVAVNCSCWMLLCRQMLPLLDGAAAPFEQSTAVMNSTVPLIAGLMFANGAPTSAAALSALNSFVCGAVSLAASVFIETAVGFALGVTAACAICPGVFPSLAEGICRLSSRALCAASAAFLAYAKLHFSFSSAADSANQFAAKAMISVVPVVGSTLSNSASSIISALAAVRSTIGAAGIAAVLVLMLPRLLRLLLSCGALFAAETMSSIFSAGRNGTKQQIRAFRRCCELMAAVQALAAVLFIFLLLGILSSNSAGGFR